MDKLGLNLGYLLVQILHFAMIYVVVANWIVKPVLGLLEKRRLTIGQGIEDARAAAEARANAEVEADKVLAETQAKAAEIMREASERAEAVGREIRAAADVEATKAREAAIGEVEQERVKMLGELRKQVVVLAMAAAQKLVGESLDEKRQKTLLEEFFSGIKAGRVTLLEGEMVSGEKAEITSALPLTEEEQNTFKQNLKTQDAIFKVDPNILGGVVVRVGDRMIDNSVAGQLQGLRQSLQK